MSLTKKITLVALGAGLACPALAQNPLDDSRAYNAEMMADADGRTSLLQGGATAGHDESGFYISSGDGNYTLYVGGMLQFRYNLNFRDDGVGEDEDFTHGFQTTRTRLDFWGNVINPDLHYKIRGNFDLDGGNGENFASNASGGEFRLQEAWVQYRFPDSGFAMTWGQMVVPFSKEQMIDAKHQLSAERSVTNELFTGDYAQGIALHYTSENWRFWGAVTDGARSANTDFNSPVEADIALTARLEIKFAGTWDRFDDFTSWRGSEFAAYIGGALHWQTHGETGTGGVTVPDFDALLYTVDGALEGQGWNLFASFTGLNVDPEGVDATDHFGVVVQGGLFVTDQFELFARWNGIFLDSELGFEDDDLHFITLGGNYYFVPESHAAKLTGEIIVALEETASKGSVAGVTFLPQTRHGILGDTDDGEISIRLQFQLLF